MKTISLQEFSENQPYGYRAQLSDERLKQSIQAHGIMEALWVTRDAETQKWMVISGHKRLQAARELGLKSMDIYELEEGLTEQDLFLRALLANFNQEMTDYDCYLAMLKALRDLKFSEARFLQEVLPALGLESQQRWIMETMRLSALDHKILEAAAQNILPFKGVACLLKFPLEDQLYFLESVAKRTKLTRSDLQKAVDDLYDLMRQNFVSLKDLLEQDSVLKGILDDKNPDLRQKTHVFMMRLAEKKNPRFSEKNEKFSKFAHRIEKDVPGLKIEAPAFFEDEGMTLHLRLKNKKNLEEALEGLKEQRSSLSELFESML